MPKVIYCLHALSTHLFKRGQAPLIQDLFGKVDFSGDYIFIKIVNFTNGIKYFEFHVCFS